MIRKFGFRTEIMEEENPPLLCLVNSYHFKPEHREKLFQEIDKIGEKI